MENKVIALMVKRGFNIETATNMVTKNLADAQRMFPEAKAAKLADVVACL